MSNPEKMIYVPFATSGQRNDILVTNPSTAKPQDASFTYGFPSATMTPKSSGGKAPNGKDVNGILYAITTDTVHRQSGKQIQFDATYAGNIGGYAKGAIVQSTDLTKSYISTVDGNLTDPDSSSSKNWNVYSQPPLATSTTVGTVKIADTLNSTARDTALTANQGNVLSTQIGNLATSVGAMFASSSMQPNGFFQIKDVYGNVIFMWQWGTVDYSSYPGEIQVDVNFPKPFPNNCFSANGTRKMSQHSSRGDAGISLIGTPSKTTASFSLQQYYGDSNGDARGFTWFAMGN